MKVCKEHESWAHNLNQCPVCLNIKIKELEDAHIREMGTMRSCHDFLNKELGMCLIVHHREGRTDRIEAQDMDGYPYLFKPWSMWKVAWASALAAVPAGVGMCLLLRWLL